MFILAPGIAQLTESDLQHLLQVLGAVGLSIATFTILVIAVNFIHRLFNKE